MGLEVCPVTKRTEHLPGLTSVPKLSIYREKVIFKIISYHWLAHIQEPIGIMPVYMGRKFGYWMQTIMWFWQERELPCCPVQGCCETCACLHLVTALTAQQGRPRQLHRKLWSGYGATCENSNLQAVLGERRIKETVFPPCQLSLFRQWAGGRRVG